MGRGHRLPRLGHPRDVPARAGGPAKWPRAPCLQNIRPAPAGAGLPQAARRAAAGRAMGRAGSATGPAPAPRAHPAARRPSPPRPYAAARAPRGSCAVTPASPSHGPVCEKWTLSRPSSPTPSTCATCGCTASTRPAPPGSHRAHRLRRRPHRRRHHRRMGTPPRPAVPAPPHRPRRRAATPATPHSPAAEHLSLDPVEFRPTWPARPAAASVPENASAQAPGRGAAISAVGQRACCLRRSPVPRE